MREFSVSSVDELNLAKMRYGMIDPDETFIQQHYEKFTELPPATPVTINAIKQIELAMEDPEARKEWADRIEGKSTQTTVSLNHDTATDIDKLEKYSIDSMNKLFEGVNLGKYDN